MTFRVLSLVALFSVFLAGPGEAGLVSWWSFDDGSGTVATDSVGANDGLLRIAQVDTDTWSDWVVGHTGGAGDGALDFGLSSVKRNVYASRYKGVADRSGRAMSLWIKTSDKDKHDFLSWGSNSRGKKWVYRIGDSGGKVRVEVNTGYQVGSTDVADGNWHHLAATWEDDGTPNVQDVKFYVDGNLETISKSLSRGINTATSQSLFIGGESWDGNRFFSGTMDDVAIWNRALTAAEIGLLSSGTVPTAIPTVAPTPTLDYTAQRDPTPTDGVWEDLTDLSSNHDWAINNNTDGARLVDVKSVIAPGITQAYSFDGSTDSATTAQFETIPGDPSPESASFEIWFRPSDLMGQEVLFETGGTTGLSMVLDDEELVFVASGGAGKTGVLTYDGLSDDDLQQVVGVVERINGGAELFLYANGNPTPVDSLTVTSLTDWCGADISGLGMMGGNKIGGELGVPGGSGAYSAFQGEIAMMRFYNTSLTGADVQALYAMQMPEPSSYVLLLLGLLGLALHRRRRQA